MPHDTAPVVVGIEHEQPGLLHYASSWARRWHVPLRVIHAYGFLDVAAELYSVNEAGPQDLAQELIDNARAHLDEPDAPPTEFSVNDGPAASVLEMESKHASAVVIGTDDVSRLRRTMGGDVARHVAMHSHAPVFVVPLRTTVEEIRDVVLAIDENNVGEGPIRFAFETARLTQARLRVLHVVPRDVYLTEPGRHGAALTRIVEEWGARFPTVRLSPSLVCGDVEDEVLIAASAAQLAVVGRPNEPHRGHVLGLHVAETIVRRGRSAVAVVPAEHGE